MVLGNATPAGAAPAACGAAEGSALVEILFCSVTVRHCRFVTKPEPSASASDTEMWCESATAGKSRACAAWFNAMSGLDRSTAAAPFCLESFRHSHPAPGVQAGRRGSPSAFAAGSGAGCCRPGLRRARCGVTDCAASSTTTASWYAHRPSARLRTKSPTALTTSCILSAQSPVRPWQEVCF